MNGHVQRRISHYTDRALDANNGYYIAWCSCGVGSPLKPTKEAATASLAAHIAAPETLPR